MWGSRSSLLLAPSDGDDDMYSPVSCVVKAAALVGKAATTGADGSESGAATSVSAL